MGIQCFEKKIFKKNTFEKRAQFSPCLRRSCRSSKASEREHAISPSEPRFFKRKPYCADESEWLSQALAARTLRPKRRLYRAAFKARDRHEARTDASKWLGSGYEECAALKRERRGEKECFYGFSMCNVRIYI